MPEDIVRREDQEMARATRRAGRGQQQKRRSSRARAAQLEQLNLNAAGIDVGATAHWVAVPTGSRCAAGAALWGVYRRSLRLGRSGCGSVRLRPS